MSTFDHGWNPQWSKAVIMFGYYYSGRMIWRLLNQLPVNVLQGKLCAACSLISRLLPVFLYSWALKVWGRCYLCVLTLCAYIIVLLFFFLFFHQNVHQLHSCLGTSTCSGGCYIQWVTIRPTSSVSNLDEDLPVTSYPCQWRAPKKRKQSTFRFADSVYGKVKKRRLKPLEDFDPRPDRFKGIAKNSLPALLNDLCGEELCISLLLDSTLCPNDGTTLSSSSVPTSSTVPGIEKLKKSVSAFKESLSISDAKFMKLSWILGSKENQPCGFKQDAI